MEYNNQMQTSRNVNIDVLRIVACFLVVLYHVPQCVSYTSLYFSDFLSHFLYVICLPIGRCAVPLFFLVSGFLLLPIKDSTFCFIKKRFSRILAPTIIWYLLYLVFGRSFPGEHYYLSILDKSPHLWFMIALIGLYLIAPILSPWFKQCSKGELWFYLLLWTITLLYPIIDFYAPIIFEYNHSGMLYDSPFKILYYNSGYIGFFLLGGVLNMFSKYIDNINKKRTKLLIFLLFLFGFSTYLCVGIFHISLSQTFAYCSIPTVSLSLFFFISINSIKFKVTDRLKRVICNCGQLSFGIYFVHLFVLEMIQVDAMGGYLRFIIAFITFFISWLFIKILSFIPYSKYIIG